MDKPKNVRSYETTKQYSEEQAEWKEKMLAEEKLNNEKKAQLKLEEEQEDESKMAYFLFTTLSAEMVDYKGPSGEVYYIQKGHPFKVGSSEDIAFFEGNKRFKRVKKLFGKVVAESQPDVDSLFKKELEGIKGLSKTAISYLVEKYISKDNFLAEVLEYGMDEKLSSKASKALSKYFEKETIKGDE